MNFYHYDNTSGVGAKVKAYQAFAGEPAHRPIIGELLTPRDHAVSELVAEIRDYVGWVQDATHGMAFELPVRKLGEVLLEFSKGTIKLPDEAVLELVLADHHIFLKRNLHSHAYSSFRSALLALEEGRTPAGRSLSREIREALAICPSTVELQRSRDLEEIRGRRTDKSQAHGRSPMQR